MRKILSKLDANDRTHAVAIALSEASSRSSRGFLIAWSDES